jgi:hypothetical protein
MHGRWTVLASIMPVVGLACVTLWGGAMMAAETGKAVKGTERGFITRPQEDAVVGALVAQHGAGVEARARRGVHQAALYWRPADGTAEDFAAYCGQHFVADPRLLETTYRRFEANLEQVSGHAVALNRALREPMECDTGDPLPVDLRFAELNVFDHFNDDAFAAKVAFDALLNFPLARLPELLEQGAGFTRRQWAEARLGAAFQMRVPGEVRQGETRAFTRADDYIANYNIFMHNLLAADGSRPFPEGMKLISHWGLRDHIKALYSDPLGNLDKQRLVLRVMEHIIHQTIPAAVVNNPRVDWAPVTNVVQPGADAKVGGAISGEREPDTRYARLLDVFHAEQAVDRFSPVFPTFIDRRFQVDRELPEAEVEQLLKDVLTAPVAREVAALIRARLGRPLEAFDIWYDGFKPRSALDVDTLDAKVRARYPDLAAVQAGIPDILKRMGFAPDTAAFLASHIVVDPARGAGHAMGAGMRSDSAHLRTRVPAGGMDYQGYNIAMHELGHCVEQVFTLNRVDSVLLNGVPNTAFTEAFAFVFQSRDTDLLGVGADDEAARARARALNAVDTFWMTFEISGVGLLDMAVWRWLYVHPKATPAELKAFVVSQAAAIWDQYYAPVLGVKGSPLLAIYSHMISSGLYLPDYPVGHLIQFQYEEQFHGRSLAGEMERMCVQGRLTPQQWMQGAVGGPVSAQPLIRAAQEGLKSLNPR